MCVSLKVEDQYSGKIPWHFRAQFNFKGLGTLVAAFVILMICFLPVIGLYMFFEGYLEVKKLILQIFAYKEHMRKGYSNIFSEQVYG